jgi:hypothetical protein
VAGSSVSIRSRGHARHSSLQMAKGGGGGGGECGGKMAGLERVCSQDGLARY